MQITSDPVVLLISSILKSLYQQFESKPGKTAIGYEFSVVAPETKFNTAAVVNNVIFFIKLFK